MSVPPRRFIARRLGRPSAPRLVSQETAPLLQARLVAIRSRRGKPEITVRIYKTTWLVPRIPTAQRRDYLSEVRLRLRAPAPRRITRSYQRVIRNRASFETLLDQLKPRWQPAPPASAPTWVRVSRPPPLPPAAPQTFLPGRPKIVEELPAELPAPVQPRAGTRAATETVRAAREILRASPKSRPRAVTSPKAPPTSRADRRPVPSSQRDAPPTSGARPISPRPTSRTASAAPTTPGVRPVSPGSSPRPSSPTRLRANRPGTVWTAVPLSARKGVSRTWKQWKTTRWSAPPAERRPSASARGPLTPVPSPRNLRTASPVRSLTPGRPVRRWVSRRVVRRLVRQTRPAAPPTRRRATVQPTIPVEKAFLVEYRGSRGETEWRLESAETARSSDWPRMESGPETTRSAPMAPRSGAVTRSASVRPGNSTSILLTRTQVVKLLDAPPPRPPPPPPPPPKPPPPKPPPPKPPPPKPPPPKPSGSSKNDRYSWTPDGFVNEAKPPPKNNERFRWTPEGFRSESGGSAPPPPGRAPSPSERGPSAPQRSNQPPTRWSAPDRTGRPERTEPSPARQRYVWSQKGFVPAPEQEELAEIQKNRPRFVWDGLRWTSEGPVAPRGRPPSRLPSVEGELLEILRALSQASPEAQSILSELRLQLAQLQNNWNLRQS